MASATPTTSGGGLSDRCAAALYAYAKDERALDEAIDQTDALARQLARG